jgi:hypothetical protein
VNAESGDPERFGAATTMTAVSGESDSARDGRSHLSTSLGRLSADGIRQAFN